MAGLKKTATVRDLWERTNQEPMGQQVYRNKWRWIGHTLRKPSSDITRQSLEWNPIGKRRVGRQCVGDLEEVMWRGDEIMWGDLELGENSSRESNVMETCG
uniref:Uncharacterized protein n=1 Tax=Trichobilharzia regenti TaxID=157069 RepID=A0AA85K7B4_TRIRE|nr:unnamed protein product [Trichobilharzia regenti]